jgi:hypothetical protein
MQTFVPCETYTECARVLDRKRLGKQRVESLQILTSLHATRVGYKYGWANHPAVKMWAGHEIALAVYSIAICEEWISRGYDDSCKYKIKKLLGEFENLDNSSDIRPSWWGDSRVHDSHKSKLLMKFPQHYSQFNWSVEKDLPYYWPV